MITEQRVKELIDEKINFSLEDIGNKISNYTTSEKISSLIKFKSDKLNTSVDRLVGEEPIKNKFIFKNQILKENIKSFNNIRNYYTIVNINNKKYITRFRVVNILEEESSKIIDDVHNNSNYLDNTPISADFNAQGLLNKLPKTAFCFYKYWQNKLTGLQSLAPTGDDFFSSPTVGSGTTPRFNNIISGILTLNTEGKADPDKIYTNILNNNTTSYYTKLLDYQPIEIIDNTIVDNYISINGNLNQIANNVILDNLIPLKNKTIDIVLGVSTFSTWSANPNVNNINNASYTDNIAFYNPLLVKGLNETYGYLPKGFGGGYCIKTAKGFQEINDFSTQSTNVKDSPFVYSSIDGFLLCYGIKDILADYTTNLFLPISISLPPIISCCRYIGDTFDNVNIFNENVGINISNPNYNLDVNGDINFTGTLFQNGAAFVTSRWELSGNDIFRLNTKVGINKSPLYNLDVNGDINFTGTLFQNGAAFVTSRWELSGNDIFRLNTKVGIGKNNPSDTLDVSGNVRAIAFNEGGTLLSSKYADVDHIHAISDITNLSTELNSKLNLTGGELTNTLTITKKADGAELLKLNTERAWSFKQRSTGAGTGLDFQSEVGNKYFRIIGSQGDIMTELYAHETPANSGITTINTAGNITASQFTENGTALSSKYSQIGHTHVISDITNLQTELSGKAPTNHTHLIQDLLPLINGSQRVIKFPTGDMTSATTVISTGMVEGQGTYTASASSTLSSLYPWWAFDSITTSGNVGWHSAGTTYDTTTGLYIGNASIGGISGEWLKLELPTQIKVYAVSILSRTGFTRRTPNTFQILGSNDNINWTSIYSQSNYTLYQDNVFQYFTINNNTGYKFLVIVIEATQSSTTEGTGTVNSVQIVELRYYGEPSGTINTINEIQTELNNKLDISGGTITGDLTINGIFISNASILASPTYNDQNGIRVVRSGTANYIQGMSSGGSGDVIFAPRFGTSPYLAIKSNGLIGINTSTPSERLDVNGTAKATSFNENGTLLSSKYAPISHTHTISDITNLQSSLDAKLNLTGGTMTGDINYGDNQIFTLSGAGRSYSYKGAIGTTSSLSRWIGKYKFSGNFANAYIHGYIHAQSGGSYGTTKFYMTLRSDALPTSSRRFYQEKTTTVYNINTLLYYDDVDTYYIGFSISGGSYQNYTWSVDIQERGDLNGYEHISTAVVADVSGLTQINDEAPIQEYKQFLQTGINRNGGGTDGIINATSEAVMRIYSTNSTLLIGEGANNAFQLNTFDNSNFSTTRPLILNAGGGNVGIGKTDPSFKLDVEGDTRVSGTLSVSQASFLETCEISRRDVNDSTWAQIGHSVSYGLNTKSKGYGLLMGLTGMTILNSSGENPIEFRHNNSTNMTILDNGNVGIGTTNPTHKLDISGTLRIGNEETSSDVLLGGDTRIGEKGVRLHYVKTSSTDSLGVVDFTTNSLWFRTGGTFGADITAIRISNSGNVGIGTNIPSDKLDVDGNIRTNGNINLFAPSATTRSIIGKHETASSEGEIIIYEAGTGNFIQNIKLNTSTASHGRFRFLTRETERMTITNTGNVGIGITTPLGLLDIDQAYHRTIRVSDAVSATANIIVIPNITRRYNAVIRYSWDNNGTMYHGWGFVSIRKIFNNNHTMIQNWAYNGLTNNVSSNETISATGTGTYNLRVNAFISTLTITALIQYI
jgi:hypothetical protein